MTTESHHQVYVHHDDGTKEWVATFANKGLAAWYVRISLETMRKARFPFGEYEVVPV